MSPGRWLAAEMLVAVAVFGVLVNRAPTMERLLVNGDHGYQLAAGAELLRGRLPGVDVLINYGPMVGVLSALALRATGNLVGEVLLCAAAWAAAIWLVLRLTRRSFGALAGVVAGGAAFFGIARFHKWYMWLLPLAALAAVDAANGLPGRRRWAAGGLVCGLGALLRPELGAAALAALAGLALADALRARSRVPPASWLPLATGFVVFPLAWAATIVAVDGVAPLGRWLAVISESLSGSIAYWSLPPPPFVAGDPLSPGSAHALLLRLLPLTELVALLLGGWLYLARHHLEREGRALMGIGLMGLPWYAHTAYRADLHHLWQGIWPLLLAVPALCSVAIRRTRRPSGTSPASTALIAASFLLALVSAAALAPIMRQPHVDLAPYGRPALAGLAELRRGLAAVPSHPYAQLVTSIDRLTRPSDRIIVLSYAPQLLVFADRGASGLCVTYQRGLFDSPPWRREHLTQLEQSPPALVVAPTGFWRLGPDEDFRATQPEMYEFLRAHYQTVVDQRANLMLLAPSDGFRAPS